MNPDTASSNHDSNLSGLGRALLGTNEGSKPSGPWVPPTAEELHQILPQYEIVKMLGRGGMGAVYMGTQTALDRPVAIKILSAALEDSDAGFAERFKNEARAMAKLNHPGIVSVYDFGEASGGLLYIVMEYVDGTDVARMIAGKGRLHTEHAMAITAHVCDALAYAHERGIIHRDIKPANIMVGYDGTVKVADFGLAKVNMGGNTLGLTQSGMAMGTLHYMAPEALMLGSAVDHRADIYAVGVMLYQMLSGKVPHGMFKMPSMVVAGLDPRYDGIIQKAMMEDREARYQSARELRGDLDGILTQPVVKLEAEAAQPAAALPTQARPQRPGGQQQPYRPPQAQSRSTPPPPRNFSLAWLWVAVLVVSAAAGWMYLDRQKHAGGAAQAQTSTTGDASKKTEIAEGWEPLFPSDSLAGWTGDTTSYRVADGVLTANAEAGNLISPRTYQSFSLRFDLKLGAGADTGISFWEDQFTGNKTQAARAYEVQLKDHSMQPAQADSRLSHGSLLFWQAAEAQTMGPLGSWNEHEIRVIGTQATVIVNGTKVVDVDLRKLQPKTDGRPLELSKGTGHIGILGRSGPVEFRNMRIKTYHLALQPATAPLPTAPTAPTAPTVTAPAVPSVPPVMNAYAWLSGTWTQDQGTPPTPRASVDLRSNYTAEMKVNGMVRQGRWSMTGKRLSIHWPSGLLHELTVSTPDAVTELSGTGTQSDGSTFALAYRKEGAAHLAPAPTPAPKVTQPTMVATPSLWIDTQGRSLQAAFVRVEGSNVILNIAGKTTPVALATLSAASQQIAQKLQATQPVAGGGTAPVVGRWLQTNDSKTRPVFIMEVLADGTAAFAGDQLRTTGQWTLQGQSLAITWSNLSRYDITVPEGSAPAFMNGRGTGANGSTWTMYFQKDGSAGSTSGPDAGWTPLFPNDSLSGWTGDISTHRVANGILVSSGRGDLISPKEYGNFHLKFDLRLAPGTNSGLGIWRTGAAGTTANATQGFEVQIQDDTAAKFKSAEYWQRHGGIYYFREPAALPMGPVGSWNTHEIRVEGTQLEVTINGRPVQKTNLTSLRPIVTRAPVLNISSRRGHLAILGREGAAEFRNMQIKELP